MQDGWCRRSKIASGVHGWNGALVLLVVDNGLDIVSLSSFQLWVVQFVTPKMPCKCPTAAAFVMKRDFAFGLTGTVNAQNHVPVELPLDIVG